MVVVNQVKFDWCLQIQALFAFCNLETGQQQVPATDQSWAHKSKMFETSKAIKQVVTVFPRKDATARYGAIELNVEVIRCCMRTMFLIMLLASFLCNPTLAAHRAQA